MRPSTSISLALAAAIGLTASTVGCSQQLKEPPKKTSRHSQGANANAKTTPSPKHKPEKPPEPPPPPPTIPKVELSEALQATCLVNVGDAMPSGELLDFDGHAKTLDSLYGKKLTVVCFWSIGGTQRSKLVAAAVLRDLANDVAAPFAAKDVAVVAVNVGDPTDEARKYAAEHEKAFVNLLDPKGEYFAQLSSERKTPRTYLLDAKGKILWFDVEYSRSARRDLTQGIEVGLKEAGK